MTDRTGNMPPLPGIFPDYAAPIVRNQPAERERAMARWGTPSSVALKGKNSDPLTTHEEIDLTAPPAGARTLQRPRPDGLLSVVARGEKQDG